MSNFIDIYNFDGKIVLYSLTNEIKAIIYLINNYFSKSLYNKSNDLYIIISFESTNELFELIKDTNVKILYTDINFKLFHYMHTLRHNYFYKNKIYDTNIIANLWNDISIDFDKYPDMVMYCRKNMFIDNLKSSLNMCNEIINNIKQLEQGDVVYSDVKEFKPIQSNDHYNKLLDNIDSFLSDNVEYYKNKEINFKEYASYYIFNNSSNIYNSFISKTITLEDVFYLNKYWYDKNKEPLIMNDFNMDFEYVFFENHCENQNFDKIEDIKKITDCQEVNEEVAFLDYIYGFYNFGEFWDVIKRLLVSKIKNIPLFHMGHSRITNIEYYFDKLQFKYPTNYKKFEKQNKLYFFKKINISIINGGFRGCIDRNYGYHFNKLLNNTVINEQSYNIYLARSKYGRSIQNEDTIVDVLKSKYNFIVLDGSESLEHTMRVFTNSKIMLGAHGSLMKNMIWAKKNPILIELCPPTRHDCFYANAKELGFFTLFILTDTNEKEEITLNDKQKDTLFKLLDKLI
jgi:hypothetical protein